MIPTLKEYSKRLLADFNSFVAKTEPSPRKFSSSRLETLQLLAHAQQSVMEVQNDAAGRKNIAANAASN